MSLMSKYRKMVLCYCEQWSQDRPAWNFTLRVHIKKVHWSSHVPYVQKQQHGCMLLWTMFTRQASLKLHIKRVHIKVHWGSNVPYVKKPQNGLMLLWAMVTRQASLKLHIKRVHIKKLHWSSHVPYVQKQQHGLSLLWTWDFMLKGCTWRRTTYICKQCGKAYSNKCQRHYLLNMHYYLENIHN